MLKALRNKKGEGYIDVAISLIVIMIVVVLALNVFRFLTLRMDMDYFAREMVKIATVVGATSHSDITARYNELKDETGINPTVSWNATYFSGSKVQYGDSIKVTISYSAELVGMGITKIPVTVTARYSGLSQQYWK